MVRSRNDCELAARREKSLLFRRVFTTVFLFLATLYFSIITALPSALTRFDCLIVVLVLLTLRNYDFNVTFFDNFFQFGCYMNPVFGLPRVYWIPLEGTSPRPQLARMRQPLGPLEAARNHYLKHVDVNYIQISASPSFFASTSSSSSLFSSPSSSPQLEPTISLSSDPADNEEVSSPTALSLDVPNECASESSDFSDFSLSLSPSSAASCPSALLSPSSLSPCSPSSSSSFSSPLPSPSSSLPPHLDINVVNESTDKIKVVVHRRKGAANPAKALILYFHGGGMVIGTVEDPGCALLAHLNPDVVVCSVDYRLAPEHPFPAPFDDCMSALFDLTSPAKRAALNIATDAQIGVAGFSGGAGLAAAVALAAAAKGIPIAGQFLMVPMLAPPGLFHSYSEFGMCNINPAATMVWFWRCYAPRGNLDFQSMYCCPINAPADALKAVAPAFIWTGCSDVLRDEGECFAALLREQGVRVTHERGRGSHIGCLVSKPLKVFASNFCKHMTRD